MSIELLLIVLPIIVAMFVYNITKVETVWVVQDKQDDIVIAVFRYKDKAEKHAAEFGEAYVTEIPLTPRF